MSLLRPFIIFAGLIGFWQLVVWASGVEPFILPGPLAVAEALAARWRTLLDNAWVTLAEILLGLLFGLLLGTGGDHQHERNSGYVHGGYRGNGLL